MNWSALTRLLVAGVATCCAGATALAQVCLGNGANLLVPFANDGTWTAVARGDDNSTGAIVLPFNFSLYNTVHDRVFINTNGNISFGRAVSTFSASGFPSTAAGAMIAPFWADVDTRPAASGQVFFKAVGANTFAVSWVNVGHYNQQATRLNTFQVVISDGTSEIVGAGRNVAFSYDTMCWTTGSASGGANGFGGTPATAGVNSGNGVDFIQIGRFNRNDAVYDGPFGEPDGVQHLNGRSFVFDASTANIPPVPESFPPGNAVSVAAGGSPLDLTVRFLSPEVGQTTQVEVVDLDGVLPRGLTAQTVPGNVASVRLQWAPGCCDQGTYRVRLVATDSFAPAGLTEVVLQINATCSDQPPVAVAGDGYVADCSGVVTPVQLSSAGTTDPDTLPEQLRYRWETTIPGASFSDAAAANPVLLVPSNPGCSVSGSVSLVVSDNSCSSAPVLASVQVTDTTPPTVTPPANVTAMGSVVGMSIRAAVDPGVASAQDACDAQPTLQGTRSDGQALNAPYPLGTTAITWTSSDDCGRSASASQQIAVTAPPLPDLTSAMTSVPLAEGFQGQTFTVGWRVTNGGEASPVAGWSDRVFMSTSPDGSNPVAIGDPLPNPRNLGAGESYERVQPVRLPETPNTYFLFVATDVNGQVLERLDGGEGNNRGFHPTPIVVRRRPTPDLVPVSVTAPADGIRSGSTIVVRFVVSNNGTGGTTVPVWQDAVYLLAEGQPLPASPVCLNFVVSSFLGQFPNPSYLPASGAGDNFYVQEVAIRLPSDITGRYQLAIYSDNRINNRIGGCGGRVGDTFDVAELDESNNVLYSTPFTIDLEPQPDLVVLSPGVSGSPILFTGVEATFTWTTQNRDGDLPLGGATDVGAWFDRVYLSRNNDPSIGSDDIAFDLVRAGTGVPLAAGQSWPGSYRTRIPLNLAGGLYFIKIRTDVQNQVSEFGFESNNLTVSASTVDVRVSPPIDPAPVAVGVGGSRTVVPQQSLTFAWEVVNEGAPPPGFVQSWRDAVFLSLDGVLDATDRLVVTADASTQASGTGTVTFDPYVRARSFVIPNDLPAGAYHVIVKTDDQSAIFEGDAGEANNVLVSDDVVTVNRDPVTGFADLQVEVVAAPPSGGALGSIAGDIGWRVTNRGGSSTQVVRWIDRVILSTTPSPANGIVVGGGTRTLALAPGQSYADGGLIALPPRMPTGTYHVIVVTDFENAVLESNESNNGVVASTSFVVSEDAGGGPGGQLPADLQVIGVVADPPSVDAGATLTVNASFVNAGPTATQVDQWADRVYLSRSPSSLVGAIQIGSGRTRSKGVEPGETYDISMTGSIPLEAEGEYFLLAWVDADLAVVESNNANNIGPSTPPRVTVRGRPQANLVPAAIASDPQGLAGQTLRVTGSVSNAGAGSTNRSDWRDAVYLSPDQFFDGTAGGDVLLGYVQRIGAVDPLATYDFVADLPLPAGISGAFYVLLRVNADNAVNEAGLTGDNTLASLGLVDISIPSPSDLAVASITPPSQAVLGQPGAYAWRLENRGGQPVVGSWTDGLFLSLDRVWSPDDKRIGNVAVRPPQAVQPNQFADGATVAGTPGVLPGNYHVVVRADVFNVVPETVESNNIGASDGTVEISAITLTPGVPFRGELPQGSEAFFQFDVPAGETVRLTIVHDDPLAWTELYAAFGRVPSTADFDQIFDDPGQRRQVVTIPTSTAGRYYAMARCAQGGSPRGFSIVAEIVPFELTSVSPNAVGAGEVTLRFQGSRFRPDTQFAVRPFGAATLFHPIRIRSLTGSEALVTFDLTGATLGPAIVQAGDGVSTLELSGLIIEPPTRPTVSVEISDGPRLRFGVAGDRFVNVTNSGNVDVPYVRVDIAAWNTPGLFILLPDIDQSPLRANGDRLSEQVLIEDLLVGRVESIRLSIRVAPDYPGTIVSYAADATPLTRDAFINGSVRQVWDRFIDNMLANQEVPEDLRASYLAYFGDREARWQDFEREIRLFGFGAGPRDASLGQKIFCGVSGAALAAACRVACVGVTGPLAVFICTTTGNFACNAAIVPIVVCCLDPCGCADALLGNCSPCATCPPPCNWITQCCPPPAGCCSGREIDTDGDDKCDPPGGAIDPNEKDGPAGYGAERWVARSQTLPYRIFFENLPTATAPASLVTITDDLDPALNPGSFRVGTIRFGDVEVVVPENRINFQTTVDLTQSRGVLLEITAGVDATRSPAQAFWIFRSIDPATGLPPVDANLGFLPPNGEAGEGEGVVEYTIRARSNTANATVVNNTADIIFDSNDVIRTNTVFNTIDSNLPFSEVLDLPLASGPGGLLLSIPGDDAPGGSGLRGVRLLVSTDGGPFVPFGAIITEPTTTFIAEPGHVYRFASQAVDHAGNVESIPSLDNADAITTVPDVRFADGMDTGVANDRVTRIVTPTFVLMGPPMSSVSIDLSGPTPVSAQVQLGAAGTGTWVVPVRLADGLYTLTMNAAGVGTPFPFIVDATPPVVAGWTSESTHGSAIAALIIDASGSSSEPRQAGIGSVVVRLASSEPSLIDLAPPSASDVSVVGTDVRGVNVPLGHVTRSVTRRDDGRTFDIRFTPSLPNAAVYCITLRNVTDVAGNPMAVADSRRTVTALVGDSFEDRRVNNTDVGGVQSLLGREVDVAVVNHVRSDVNGNGRIDAADRSILLAARGSDLRAVASPCPAGRDGGQGPDIRVTPVAGGKLVPAPIDPEPGSDGRRGPVAGPDGVGSLPVLPTATSAEPSATPLLPSDWTLVATRLAVQDVRGVGNIRPVVMAMGWSESDAQPWATRGWWMVTLHGRDPKSAARMLCQAGLFAAPIYDTPHGDIVVGPSIEILSGDPAAASAALGRVDPAARIMPFRGNARAGGIKCMLSGCDGFRVLDQLLLLREQDGIEAVMPLAIPGEGQSPLGDCDLDGRVDENDVAELLKLVAAGDVSADINADGLVNVEDSKFLLDLLAR